MQADAQARGKHTAALLAIETDAATATSRYCLCLRLCLCYLRCYCIVLIDRREHTQNAIARTLHDEALADLLHFAILLLDLPVVAAAGARLVRAGLGLLELPVAVLVLAAGGLP